MGLSRKIESRAAFAMALDLLDAYLNDEPEVRVSESHVAVRVGDTLNADGGLPTTVFDEWLYTINCVSVPSCCAGECVDYEPEHIGHVDIRTSRTTYSFSIHVLLSISEEGI